jgi:hypothetical protein
VILFVELESSLDFEPFPRAILVLPQEDAERIQVLQSLKRDGSDCQLFHIVRLELPARVRERVQMAPEARLDAWAERVVSASCLEDVFGS